LSRPFRGTCGVVMHQNNIQSGREAALEYIREARALSVELGGTDKDVKRYFFGLDRKQLAPILDTYEVEFGTLPRAYAEETMPLWRSGRRRMSGLVAGRLFSLLPRFMPLRAKYALVKSLWEAKCPRSHHALEVGPDVAAGELFQQVRRHLQRVVGAYRIPESISNRFAWLAQEDVDLQQELHNYFLRLNRDVVSRALESRVGRLIAHVRACRMPYRQITQQVRIGNHRLDLVFRPDVSGIRSRPARAIKPPSVPDEGRNAAWIIIICLVMLALFFLMAAGSG